jgi:hypothetical protein
MTPGRLASIHWEPSKTPVTASKTKSAPARTLLDAGVSPDTVAVKAVPETLVPVDGLPDKIYLVD